MTFFNITGGGGGGGRRGGGGYFIVKLHKIIENLSHNNKSVSEKGLLFSFSSVHKVECTKIKIIPHEFQVQIIN